MSVDVQPAPSYVNRRGGLVFFGIVLIVFVFLVVVFPQTDIAAWTQSLGTSTPEQAEMLKRMYAGPVFWIVMGLSWAVYVAFLLYVRRFFFPRQIA